MKNNCMLNSILTDKDYFDSENYSVSNTPIANILRQFIQISTISLKQN